jgi:hypothetical protein
VWVAFPLIPLAFACFALSPAVLAVMPAPDGGYPTSNTAEGEDALFSRTTGNFNTVIGGRALYRDTSGSSNTVVGAFALALNVSGNQNVTVGPASFANTTGNGNTAVGFLALVYNQGSGNLNDAFGFEALFTQQTALNNDGFGWETLYNNVTGDNNTAMGHGAGLNITGNGNVDIGANVSGVAGENNITRIRNIGTTPYNTGQTVHVDANGKLGYFASSRRYKDDIKPMDKDSEALFAVKPVSFRYKGDIDPSHAKMFGLIAEEVAEVDPDLVVRNTKGEVDTIRFDSINAMLLNEFLKEQRKLHAMEVIVEQQKKNFEAIIAQRQKQIKSLTATLREQARQIQEVSERFAAASPSFGRLEASKPSPQMVNNP